MRKSSSERVIIMRENLCTQGELAEKLAININVFRRCLDKGVIPPPTHQIAGLGRKYYTIEEIDNISKQWKNPIDY